MRVKGVFVILLDAEAEREDEKENKYKQRGKKKPFLKITNDQNI